MAENQAAEASSHEKAHRVDPAPPQQANLEGLYAPQLPLTALQLMGDPRLNGRGNQPVKTAIMQRMQRSYGNRATQRFLQRASNSTDMPTTDDIGTRIQAKIGTGASLDAGVREQLEPSMRADLSSARVHTDSEADNLARSVDAVAFTTGNDIFFRDGAYNPSTADGLRLLAHEATHTVQQAAGPVEGTPIEGGVAISDPSDSFEQSAARTAEAVMSGNPALQTLPDAPLALAPPVQRRVTEAKETQQVPVQTMRASSSNTHVPVQKLTADAALVPVQRDGPAATKTKGTATVTYKPAAPSYTVNGKTLEEAAEQITAREEAGLTEWKPKYDVALDDDGNVKSVTVVVNITVTMPIWSQKGARSKAAQAEWSRFYKALDAHEQGHVKLVKNKVNQALVNSMLGKSQSDANTAFQSALTELDTESEAYDKANDHGRKAGCTIDLSIDPKPAPKAAAPTQQEASPEEMPEAAVVQPMRVSTSPTYVQRQTSTGEEEMVKEQREDIASQAMPVQTTRVSSSSSLSVPVQREDPPASPAPASTPGQKGVGGKQTFTTKKLNIPANTPMGPIEYAGADAYAEINYELFDSGQDAGAQPGSSSSTQVRAGVTATPGDIGAQAEIQKQWEPIALSKLGSFKPTAKGGGNLTKKGGEIGVEGGVEGEKFSTSLKFTIISTDFEKGGIEFPTLTSQWEFPVFKPEPMNLSGGRQASTDIKAKFDFKFKPNYKAIAKWLTEALAELGLEGAATLGLELAVITGPIIAMAVTIQVGEAKNQIESDARMGAISVRNAATVYGLNMIGSDSGGSDKAAEEARAKGKKDFSAMAQKSGLSEESFRHDIMEANTKGKFYDSRRFSKEALQAADFPYRAKAGKVVNDWASEHYILAAMTDMRYFHKKVDDVITEQFNKL